VISKDTLDNIWGVIQYITGVLIVVTVITLVKAEETHAAEFHVLEGGFIDIQGRTTYEDVAVLIMFMNKYPDTHTVLIGGPGGLALAGVALAHLVHDYNLNVIATKDCYSACAMVWVAGKNKTSFEDVGVYQHGVYVAGSDSLSEEEYQIWESMLTELYDKVAPTKTKTLLNLIRNPRNEWLKLN